MKKNKILFLMLLVVCFSLFGILSVKAFPSSLTMKAQGDSISLNPDNSFTLSYDVTQDTAKYPWFHIKNSNQGRVLCLSGLSVNAPGSGIVCSYSNAWTNSKDSYAIAYIIDTINKTNASNDLKYWWQEVLINGYFGNLDSYQQGSRTHDYITNSDRTILNTGKSYKKLMSDAVAYSNTDFSTKITVDNGKNATLTFTLGEDGYYYSNKIIISSNASYDMGTLSDSKFSYDKDGDSYVFKIKSSDIEAGKVVSFSKTITIEKTYMNSSKYACGSNYQDLALTTVETNKNSDSITITGSVYKEQSVVKISKIDAAEKKELPGATLEIQDEEGNVVKYCTDEVGNKNSDCKWVSTDKPYEIEGLPIGKYYLVETLAPKGYELNKEKVMFEVKEGVVITEVVMENQIEVEVPSTLSSRSALLLTIAMFDIALGIGIVTYVKKNKIKE